MGRFNREQQAEMSLPNRSWLTTYYMAGYDVGELKGFTDLPDKPRCDEEGTQGALKWKRYGSAVTVAGLADKTVETIDIPATINGHVVAGVERMAFLHCSVQSIRIPETVLYIGGMAVGFTSRSAFSDEQERELRAQSPFAENLPTSVFMSKEYFFHIDPKPKVIGKAGTAAERYAKRHRLLFLEM